MSKRVDTTLRVFLVDSDIIVIANQYAIVSITLLIGFVITMICGLNTSYSVANIIPCHP
jgi:hypothetical protein